MSSCISMTIDGHPFREDLHRPDDPAVLAREAQRLAAAGLTAYDIAQAFRLSAGAVRMLLAASDLARDSFDPNPGPHWAFMRKPTEESTHVKDNQWNQRSTA
ncbi:MAG: hypothetical protein R3F24_05135 [Gammaproteobacteria bacterium]